MIAPGFKQFICNPARQWVPSLFKCPFDVRTFLLMSHRRLSVVLLLILLTCLSGVSPGAATANRPNASSVGDTLHVPQPPLADSTVRGVVWTPPDHPGPALRTLSHMAAAGVTAVRLTTLPPADTILGRADALDLQLYVDLPVSYVGATALRDSLAAAQTALTRLERLAGRYASLHAVGLAQHADTSVPAACSALHDWTDRLHSQAPSLRTYYVTPFPAPQDQCADAVDRPLLDVRDRPAPAARWAAWTDTTAAAGIGALGTWVHTGAGSGLRVPHSPERQARHLETAFSALLTADSSSAPPPVFVSRWSDAATPSLPFRHYGTRTTDGSPRPVADVLRGFYTDTQHVFAFPLGSAPPDTPIWALLLGWILLALLGSLYTQNLYVRQTLFRYFGAHGFYRDAIRRGREVGFTENAVLLSGIGVALSIIGTIVARITAHQPATGLVVEALPPVLQWPLATGLTHPLLAGGVVGVGAVALLVGWMLVLVGVAQRTGSFSLGQGLMLITWPCWPALLGMLVALVAATDPPLSTGLLGLVLLIGGGVTLLAITVRVLRNYWLVSDVPLPIVALLVVPSPAVVLLLTYVVLHTQYSLPLSLLWHLATRT